MHYRQCWSKSITVKWMLLAMTLSHQVIQHLFRELGITAEWTCSDNGRMVVFVTGLAQIGNAHQCSRPDGSTQPCVTLLLTGCGVGSIRPREQGRCRSC